MQPKSGDEWSADEEAQIREYVAGSNVALLAGFLSPSGRVTTTSLGKEKQRAIERERARNPGKYPPGVHPGHVPDTTWTGKAEPFNWQALDARVNMSLGAQALRYSIGYKPTSFWYYKDYIATYGALPQ
jgi:hypothetical protein